MLLSSVANSALPRNTPQRQRSVWELVRYTEAASEGIEPIFISVKEAAKALGLSPWSTYQLCDEGKLDSRYQGRRRLVLVKSVRDYAASLPSTPGEASA